MNRRAPRARLFTWLVALVIGGAMGPSGCTVDRDDSYELVRRGAERAPGEPTPLRYAADDDASAVRVRRLMSDELSGELLRTFAMARRLVVETAPPTSVRRARAALPPYLALGVNDLCRGLPYRDREVRGAWWRRAIPSDAPIAWIDDEPSHSDVGQLLASVSPRSGAAASDQTLRDAVVLDQIVTGLGRAILALIAPPGATLVDGALTIDDPLGAGYLKFLEVVAAEWGASRGDAAADARALLRRADWFADVRANRGILHATLPYRDCFGDEPTQETLEREPLVIATFIYQLASSEVGHRLAADETYKALVPELPPPGFSPGRLLGAFRNFQAKLLWAWNRAVVADRPPRDLVDLVRVYGDAFPAERAEVTRIFVLTTRGFTLRYSGLGVDGSPEQIALEVATLTADVLAGRRELNATLPLRGRL